MSGARGCFNCGGFGHQAANCPKAGTPTCRATALTMRAEEAVSLPEAVAQVEAQNATGAVRSGTSRVRALRPAEAARRMPRATAAGVPSVAAEAEARPRRATRAAA
ncbi:hypothetical protein B0H11DRAFT_1338475 [Mycena galericulata]|nr:hypothetical protein B0H11DRAFT_1338475 [Mycena galericulata]